MGNQVQLVSKLLGIMVEMWQFMICIKENENGLWVQNVIYDLHLARDRQSVQMQQCLDRKYSTLISYGYLLYILLLGY